MFLGFWMRNIYLILVVYVDRCIVGVSESWT
jgi:hypothetical protein